MDPTFARAEPQEPHGALSPLLELSSRPSARPSTSVHLASALLSPLCHVPPAHPSSPALVISLARNPPSATRSSIAPFYLSRQLPRFALMTHTPLTPAPRHPSAPRSFTPLRPTSSSDSVPTLLRSRHFSPFALLSLAPSLSLFRSPLSSPRVCLGLSIAARV